MIGIAEKLPVQIKFTIFQDSVESLHDISTLVGKEIKVNYHEPSKPFIIIPTLEGDHKANVGDVIIKGIKGECYPCKRDIFDLTYRVIP